MRPATNIATLSARLWFRLTTRPASAYAQNERRLLLDGIGAGIVNGIAVYLPVFLVRLGASNLQVGGVSGLPALTAAVLSIPVGAFLARRAGVVGWLAWSRLIVWASFPIFGLLPFVLRQHLPEAMLAVWAAVTLPQVVHAVGITVVMSAVVDDAHRFQFLSRRWAAAALSTAVTIAVVGQLIPLIGFPGGYQAVFIGSLAASLFCFWVINRVQVIHPGAAAPAAHLPRGSAGWRQQGRDLLGDQAFLRFLAVIFVYQMGLQLVVPLLPLYWVRRVLASDNAIGIISSVQMLVAMGAYFVWTRVARHWGKRGVLLASCLGLSLYPALTAATHTIPLLVVWAALAGFFAAGVDLTFIDLLMSAGRREAQPIYVGLYTTSANTAAFVAPVLGTLLAGVIGIGPALVLGTVLRLAGLGLMVLLRVGAPKVAAPAALIAAPVTGES